MKKVKFKNRIKKRVCPVCGGRHVEFWDHHVEYPEIWTTVTCLNCGCVVEYQDNCLPQNIWDFIKEQGVRCKAKVLKAVRDFYSANENINKIE